MFPSHDRRGLRSVSDAGVYFGLGADKIAVNTGAIENPRLIPKLAQKYGSQSVVLSVDVKDQRVVSNCGRQLTILDPVEWIKQGIEEGAGEVLLTSVERDGSLSGYDLELLRVVSESVPVPIMVLGGGGAWPQFYEAFSAGADAVCTQNIYHFTDTAIVAAKQYLHNRDVPMRMDM